MYKTLRSVIWLGLVALGLICVVSTAILAHSSTAWIPVGIAVIVFWVGCGILSSWVFGIARHAKKHLRKSLDFVTFVDKDVGATRMADYVQTLEHLQQQQNATRFGMAAELRLSHLKTANSEALLVDWTTVEGTSGDLISIPSNAIYLLAYDGEPFVARAHDSEQREHHFEHEDAWTTGAGKKLEIAARSLEAANKIIQWLASQSSQHSVYRGCMLHVASPKDGTSGQTIRIVDRSSTDRERIIMPDDAIGLLERLTASGHRHHAALARFGHSSSLGILLHGPPGTGKTLVTRYVISTLPEHTIIVPTDMDVETIRACFRLAKYLPPAAVVIEDVDLLATHRSQHTNTDGLQELMNEMDGLSGSSSAIVIMSTNMPELLEPALASRPGRVSQAIEFPLPDEDARHQLLELFLSSSRPSNLPVEPWAQRLDGASPAFIEELCKRSIMLASERCPVSDEGETPDIFVNDADMHQAMHELIVTGGRLTAGVLGFPADGT